MRHRYKILGGMAVLVFVLDQASKWLIMAFIPEYRSVMVIPDLFDLVNIRNRGAAFGFLNRSDIEWQFWLFLAATVVAAWTIFALVRTARYQPWLFTCLGFVLGGALGNLADRLRFRAVVDFLDFHIGGLHWPAFNVADMSICMGAFLACLLHWRQSSAAVVSREGTVL
ncbi:signal peptidase II [Candidatus Desulfovibrio trichonymphae]|uniref:Lipoprotein signal peptidase n=1 Tax=Candidatus Desulfovibrio trichonymphae TaxID=1725232 RepID=A0A1J1DZD6_9BACT|nr:signal peptidase II [Candidatus Desulfovibrio trichonymphae]BAV92518.1 signal peptidase II [Candidatus Desulfovibrio trichonymphae]GHU90118.1 lipoprotein signal peptidase [Deltaproteobacteria bacterium]GHU98754.1 lipoprotein signal peptidase [Deltaproteobacteria bacterium]